MPGRRPQTGDRPPVSFGDSPITRRQFLVGGAALVVMTACGPGNGNPPVGPTGGTGTQPTGDNGYLEDLMTAPGSPAFAGKEVVLGSESGAFGTDGKIYFTRSSIEPEPDDVIDHLGTWSADELTVSIPEKAPSDTGTPASSVPARAPFRLTIEPDGAPSVHVDIFVWSEGGEGGYEVAP